MSHKLITVFCLLFSTTFYDNKIYYNCVYPTVIVKGPGVGSGVIVQSKWNGHEYENIVFSVYHVSKNNGDYLYTISVPNYNEKFQFKSWSGYFFAVSRGDHLKDISVLKFISDRELPHTQIDWDFHLKVNDTITKVGCGNTEEPHTNFGVVKSLNANIKEKTDLYGNYLRKDLMITNAGAIPGDSGGGIYHNNKLVGLTVAMRGKNETFFLSIRNNFTPNDLGGIK
jgi:hypothetical protein